MIQIPHRMNIEGEEFNLPHGIADTEAIKISAKLDLMISAQAEILAHIKGISYDEAFTKYFGAPIYIEQAKSIAKSYGLEKS